MLQIPNQSSTRELALHRFCGRPVNREDKIRKCGIELIGVLLELKSLPHDFDRLCLATRDVPDELIDRLQYFFFCYW